ncbi:MAG: hypothetical protein ABIP03_03815 [Aquihabitans sp.]
MRWTGIAAVAALWSTQAVLVAVVGFSLVGERPLSYLALEDDIGFVFGMGLTVSAVLFIVFQRQLRHRYQLGVASSVSMVVAMTGQFIAGVVPIGGTGPASRIHVAAALTLGATIPVVMWRFAADQPAGVWRRRCYALFWLEVAACAAGIALSRNEVAPLAELLPALAFHIWVATVTFGPFGGALGQWWQSDSMGSRGHDLAVDRPRAAGAHRWEQALGMAQHGRRSRAQRGQA